MESMKGQQAKRLKDIEDDRELETAVDRKGKKGKPDKPARPDKGYPRRHPALYAALITALTLLVLVCGVVLLCRLGTYNSEGDFQYFIDPHGVVRGPILLFLNPEEVSREEYYEIEIQSVLDRDLELDEWEDELNLFEEELSLRETELDDRESAMDDKESIIDEWLEKINETSAQGSGNPDDILYIAKKVEKMTPARAALMLEEMDEANAVALLSQMKPAIAGPILDRMPEDVAAALIEAMMPDPDAFSDLEIIPE